MTFTDVEKLIRANCGDKAEEIIDAIWMHAHDSYLDGWSDGNSAGYEYATSLDL